MKVFDIINLKKEFDHKVDRWMAIQLGELNKNNPGWIDKVKQNLTNEDGTIKELSEEETKEKVSSILNSSEFSVPQLDLEIVYELFEYTKEKLNKFIIEQ